MEYGGWKLARAADRPSPLPRDANDPTNFPIVPYHREDLIPRWRLINDRRLITMARAAEAIQSAATSIFRAGSLTVGASSILERLNEFIGNRWNGELIGFTILVSSRNNYRAPLPWLPIYWLVSCLVTECSRLKCISLFWRGEKIYLCQKYFWYRRRLSLKTNFIYLSVIHSRNCR